MNRGRSLARSPERPTSGCRWQAKPSCRHAPVGIAGFVNHRVVLAVGCGL